ncbi:SOS response-associated peptidase [Methylobacterium sp. C25]|uniref:SOS response-associated peptidase n=1 Tax=Methylobacterium sp. C25 TaxID=2721622 RepID=UPI001F1CCBAD|nr:SOS response-associated peptidase [Methylobacterium sp. C25]MCE4225792.1 SOS response-associated peptidase [Methylobacterium sp. C25]
MCGRYVIALTPELFRRAYGYVETPNFPARYNVAPTQPVPIVTNDHGTRHFLLVRWGFWPSWLKDPADFPLIFNARVETLAEKPTFRGALRHRRCVFLADGFYEWRREGKGKTAVKTPYLIRHADGGPMALAGLWETWSSPDGSEVDTATIVTCGANGTLSAIHERMPAILSPEAVGDWLDTVGNEPRDVIELCRPCPDEWLTMSEVGDRVNNARNDDAGLVEPVGKPMAAPKPAEPRRNAGGEQGSLL